MSKSSQPHIKPSQRIWTFSWHALERGVEMALDADEIRSALSNPTSVYMQTHGTQCRVAGRIVLVCNPKTYDVITILWDKGNKSWRNNPQLVRDGIRKWAG